MSVSTLPYLREQDDIDAVVAGIKNMQEILSAIPDLEWSYPPANTSAADFVADVSTFKF